MEDGQHPLVELFKDFGAGFLAVILFVVVLAGILHFAEPLRGLFTLLLVFFFCTGLGYLVRRLGRVLFSRKERKKWKDRQLLG